MLRADLVRSAARQVRHRGAELGDDTLPSRGVELVEDDDADAGGVELGQQARDRRVVLRWRVGVV